MSKRNERRKSTSLSRTRAARVLLAALPQQQSTFRLADLLFPVTPMALSFLVILPRPVRAFFEERKKKVYGR